jgi:hypothetical protein
MGIISKEGDRQDTHGYREETGFNSQISKLWYL